MQNNESRKPTNKFARLWKGKGYYMILSFCILAIGVGGYFFLSGAVDEENAVQQTLSIPATVEDSPTTAPTPQTPEDKQSPETEKPAQEQTGPLTVLPVSGEVVLEYAMDHLTYHPTTQDWRTHNGVDLSAELGQAVRAPRAGTVSAVYEDEYYGTTVVIRHENGYTSQLSNLAADVPVKAGDVVAVGDTIGTVGDTALMEAGQESHVHFSVTCQGEPVDPASFLS